MRSFWTDQNTQRLAIALFIEDQVDRDGIGYELISTENGIERNRALAAIGLIPMQRLLDLVRLTHPDIRLYLEVNPPRFQSCEQFLRWVGQKAGLTSTESAELHGQYAKSQRVLSGLGELVQCFDPPDDKEPQFVSGNCPECHQETKMDVRYSLNNELVTCGCGNRITICQLVECHLESVSRFGFEEARLLANRRVSFSKLTVGCQDRLSKKLIQWLKSQKATPLPPRICGLIIGLASISHHSLRSLSLASFLAKMARRRREQFERNAKPVSAKRLLNALGWDSNHYLKWYFHDFQSNNLADIQRFAPRNLKSKLVDKSLLRKPAFDRQAVLFILTNMGSRIDQKHIGKCVKFLAQNPEKNAEDQAKVNDLFRSVIVQPLTRSLLLTFIEDSARQNNKHVQGFTKMWKQHALIRDCVDDFTQDMLKRSDNATANKVAEFYVKTLAGELHSEMAQQVIQKHKSRQVIRVGGIMRDCAHISSRSPSDLDIVYYTCHKFSKEATVDLAYKGSKSYENNLGMCDNCRAYQRSSRS